MQLRAERATLVREGVLALGFVLLLVAAAWTVALPELTHEAEAEPGKTTESKTEPAAPVTRR